MNRDAKAMISSGLKIMSAVEPCCQTLSLTLSVISSSFGSGVTESVVVIHGPRAANPSPHLPLSQSKKSSKPDGSRPCDAPLHRARGDVVDHRVPADVVAGLGERDVAAARPDDDGELELPVEGVRDAGQRDGLARPDDRRRGLDEQLRDDLGLVDALAAALLDVRLEVAGHRQQLARSPDRRQELDVAERPAAGTGVGGGAGRGERRRARAQEREEVAGRHAAAGRLDEIDDPFIASRADDGTGARGPVGTTK